jgi:hypothetical protein
MVRTPNDLREEVERRFVKKNWVGDAVRRFDLEVPTEIAHYVPWGKEGLLVPAQFSAVLRDSRYPVRLEIAIEDGRAVCTGISRLEVGKRLRLHDGTEKGKWITKGDPITASLFRRMPLDRILHEIIDAAAVELVDILDPMTQEERAAWMPAAGSKSGRERLREARKGGRGVKLTDADLRRAADIYRAALKKHDPPTRAVADQLHLARSTAGRWVFAARKRGFLGPATPRQAGERKGQQ